MSLTKAMVCVLVCSLAAPCTAHAQAATAPPAEVALADVPAGADAFASVELVDMTQLTSAGSGAPSFERASIDTEVLIALLRERAQEAGIQTVVRLFRGASGQALPIYVGELLAEMARLLASDRVPTRDDLRNVGRILVTALLAEAVVRTQLEGAAHQAHMVAWVYWALGFEELLEDPRRDRRPPFCRAAANADGSSPCDGHAMSCDAVASAEQEQCRDLAALSADDARAQVASLVNLQAVFAGLGVLRRLEESAERGAPIDIDAILGAIASAAEDGRTLIDLEQVSGMANLRQLVQSAELARLTAGLRELRTAMDDRAPETPTQIGWIGEPPSATREAACEAYVYLCTDDADALRCAETPAVLPAVTDETDGPFDMGASAGTRTTAHAGLCAALRAIVEIPAPAPRSTPARALVALAPETATLLDAWSLDAQTGALAELSGAFSESRAVFLQLGDLTRINGTALDGFPVASLGALITLFDSLTRHAQTLANGIMRVLPTSRATDDVRAGLATTRRILGVARLFSTLATGAPTAVRVEDLVTNVAALVDADDAARPVSYVLQILEPILTTLRTGERLDIDELFAVISRVDLDELLRAFGYDGGVEAACTASLTSPGCLVTRGLELVLHALQGTGTELRIDAERLAEAAAELGDDFSRSENWRPFFHATIGAGSLYYEPVLDAEGSDRWAPLITEQLGVGIASPVFEDLVTVKFGLFGSGLLYRAVLDSRESDAVLAGFFLAVDITELLELYVAPTLLVFPSTAMQPDVEARPGLTFGLQVPLGDYLSRL